MTFHRAAQCVLVVLCFLAARRADASTTAEYWAGINQDGHARNASSVSLDGDVRVRWARALTNFNDTLLQARINYAGQRGNGLAIRDGRILALVPNATNPLAQAASQYFATFGTFALRDGTKLHQTLTPHLGAGTRGSAALQDSDTTYGYVNFYWNREDTVFTGYGADIGRAYAFDAFSGTLAPYTPFARMAESPNGSGYFAMTYDNPRLYARGALNSHYSYSRARAGVVGQGEQPIDAMKHYNSYLVSGWDVFGFTMTHYTDDTCFPTGLGTKLTNYRYTNSPYGVVTNWTASFPSNTFAGFGLHHVRGAPRPLALGTDGRIYYYGFRNTMSGSTPTAADYASGMRLFAVNAGNGQPLFEISSGWNPDADAGLASTATWGTQRYHYFLPQIAVLSNRVMVFHPQVNQGHTTNLWTRGRLFCFDTASTSLAWSVTYTNDTFNAKVRMDDVVYNPSNNTSPNCMWGDNTEQAVQLTIAGSQAYVVDPGIQGGGSSGPLQLSVYRYTLADGSVTVTNLVPVDETTNTITAYAERMVNMNDNTNRVALRELAAVDGALVALVDVDLKAQALVVIEGSTTVTNDQAPAAAITSPYAGIPPALQTFNDHRGVTAARTNIVPVLNRLGTPQMKFYDTGSAVDFDAAGSTDPDGGALAYSWSFGDGTTGSGATTSHVYASWGGAPQISNLTVRLTVTDNEGNSNTTTRTIWVRDVGSSTTTTLTASADGYIFTAGTSSNSNFGSAQDLEIRRIDHSGVTQEVAYIKFDLTGVDVAAVTDAVLRVYVMTPKEFQLEAHATSNGWAESTLRGTNAPPVGVRLGDVITSGYDPIGTWSRGFHQWVEFPVLAHVKDTSYGTNRSFAIVATNANASPLELASRNNTTWPNSAPQLVLRTGSAGYGGPTITSAPPSVIVYTNATTQTLSVAASSAIGATNLAYSWRQVSGPARATLSTLHSTGAGSTTVSIPPGGGVYVFRGMVDDGLLYTETEITFQETAAVSFALTATVNNVSWGSVSPTAGTYTSGTVVQVTATPSNGFSFVNWTGDASGSANPLSLTMEANKSITANFVTNEPPAVTTNTLTVVSAYGQSVPEAGDHDYTNGSILACSITNTPLLQSSTTQVFASGWTLAGNSPTSGSTTNFDLTLTNSATLTWLWQTNVLLQAAAAAHGSVSSTGGWYALGASVTVTATADSGYTFAGWSGDLSGSTNANPMTQTLDRARSVTANFVTNPASGGQGLAWRVDFNGSNNDTLTTSNFTGWTVSSTSRTQSFANVDGGSINSSITVRLLGSGTFNNYQRTMNAGTATNLYRDGAQNTAAITLALSNLTPFASYNLRIWYFDDEFTLGTTQTYVNVTDGGSTTLGALTNTLTGNASAGHASLPSGLYDSRYALSAALTAGTNGQVQVSITPSAGNAKINAFELMDASGGEPASYTLSVYASTGGSVSPTGGTYAAGSNVQIVATASNHYQFVGWTGAITSAQATTNILMNTNQSVWAVFELERLTQTVVSAHGSPIPAGGFVTNYGAVITNTVNSPVISGGTQYVCTGWTLSAHEPAAGTTNLAIVTLTNSTTLTWQWTVWVPTPTSMVAQTDGAELVRLGWSENYEVLIVHRAGAAPTAGPSNGVTYATGDALGDGTIIYRGSGSGARDHVVAPGTAQHYVFYAITNLYYSPGVLRSVTTTSYAAGAVVEAFSYTQTVSLASLNGGAGFTNGWTINAGAWTIRTNATTPNIDASTYYPSRAANKIELADPGNGGDADTYRNFAPVTGGKLYVSYLMSYQYNGANKYAGLSLMSNGTERAFVGEIYSQNQQLGLASHGGADVGSAFTLAPYDGGGGNTGNLYAVVLRYDFSTRQLDAKAFARNTEVPSTEPVSWDAGVTLAAGRMDSVNGLRLAAGAGSAGDGTVGNVYWDELHVATNWAGLLNLTGPILSVAPTTLVFNVNLGQTPSPQSFAVSNSNEGTLIFSNALAYSGGASNWLTLTPVTGSLAAANGMSVTATVPSATLPRGTYTCTGTVYAGAAGVRAVSVTLTVTGFNGQVAYDAFDYTALDYVEGKNGGSGWSGSWSDNAGNTPNPVIGSGSLATFDNYCNDGGNRVFVDMADCGGGGEDACPGLYREVYRSFPALTSGVVYLGFKLKAQYTGSGKDYGVMLSDDGIEKLKVGKVSAGSNNLGLQTTDGLSTTAYGLGGEDSEYLILARYDFDSRELKVKGYYGNDLGTSESWESTTRIAPAGSITRLNRITLFARNGLSGETAGLVRWDDVRVATTWSDLLCGLGYPQDFPVVTNALFGATFTDAQIAATNLLPALDFFSAQGVRSDSSTEPFFVPNFDLVSASGEVWLSNQPFSLFTYGDLGRSLRATTTAYSVEMTRSSIGVGTNYLRWSAITSNQGYRTDQALWSHGSNLTFTVTDDDQAGPVATLLYVGTNYIVGATSTQITDGDLAAGGVMDIAIRWSDPSGLWLTNDIASSNVISSLGNVWPNWDLTNSLNQDFGFDAIFTNWFGAHGATDITNVAYNIAALDPADITVDSLWTISVSAQDMDRDRGQVVMGAHTVSVDRAVTTNQSLTFSVVDDDTEGPHFRMWTVDGGEEIGYTELERGDLAIIQFYIKASAGSEQMHFVSWKSLGVGAVLKLTDWGWTTAGGGSYTSWPWGSFGGVPASTGDLDFSNSFVGARTEKNLSWVGYMPSVVTEVQPAGAAYSNNFLFPSTWYGWWSGAAFQGGGDQIFVFQGDWSNPSSINTLYGLGNGERNSTFTNGFWYADATNHMSSALPPVLTNGLTAMSFNFANGTYTGRTVFYNREEMLNAVADWRNWTGNNLTAQFSTIPVRTNRFELWNAETRYQVTDERMGVGISISGVVFDAYSGIYGRSAGSYAPTLTLYRASGATVYGQVMNLGPTVNGEAKGYGQQANLGLTGIALSLADIELGTYTARVSVSDYDVDRAQDSLSRSYDLPIVVVDDDVSPPKFISLNFDTLVVHNQSTNLARGDIAFVEYYADTNSVPALERHFAFALLTDMAAGTVVNFSDQGWREDTTNWQSTTEGHLAWTAPSGGLDAGTVVYITNTVVPTVSLGHVSVVQGTFSLDRQGDQILAYTGSKTNPFFIAAVNAADDNLWNPTPGASFRHTSLPPGLTNDLTANLMGDRSDGVYFRTLRNGLKDDHLRKINDPFSWHLGDDRQFVVPPQYDIRVIPSGTFYNAGEVPEGRIDGYSITGLVQDVGSGLFGLGSSNAPSLRIYDQSGTLVLSTNFSVGPAFNGDGKNTPVSIAVSNVLVDLQFGNTYTAVVVITDYDVDRAQQDWLQTTQVVAMSIIDDDTNSPQAGLLDVYVKKGAGWSNTYVSGTGSNRYFEVTDGDLRSLSSSTQLLYSFNIYDTESGIPRGLVGADTNLKVTVRSWFTNNLTNFSAAYSSPDTRSITATSLWSFGTPVSYDDVSRLFGPTNLIEVTLPYDDDNDRAGDRMPGFTNRQFGLWHVSDDDAEPPSSSLIPYGGYPIADRFFWVTTNGAALAGSVRGFSRNHGSGSNVVWTLTDAEMMAPAASQIRFAFGAMDQRSGLARGTSGSTNSVMSFSLSTFRPPDFTNFDATASSPDGSGIALTNVWTFPNGSFSDTLVGQLVEVGEQPVNVTLPDTDADRSNDTSISYGEQVGFLRVEDDDVSARPLSNLLYNAQSAALLATSFDDEDGWTNYSSFGTYTNVAPDGAWILSGMSADEPDDRFSALSRGRMLSFDGTGSYLQPPPVANPGAMLVWMRNSAGSDINQFTLDYWPAGGSAWISAGVTNSVSSTNYVLFSFPVDYSSGSVTLRLVAISVASASVYMDDLAVTRFMPWTNIPATTLTWGNPSGEASGIYQYRYTNAAGSAPTGLTEGATTASNGVSFAQLAEGVTTGYVFMVDDDNDRSNDRTKGMNVPYRPRMDLTPPPRVTSISATNGPDEASEIQLNWGALPHAGNRGDGESLSPWHTYTVYYEECDSCPVTTNSPAITFTNGPADLATNTTASGIFSNFNFAANYRLVISGSDRAGNQGALSDTVDVQTVNFLVTQGLTRVSTPAATSNQVEVSWVAAETKVYDVLYTDSPSLSDTLSNTWKLMSTVTNSWMLDNGGTSPDGLWRVGPALNQHTMRFYRVARQGTWRTNLATRRASREVYAAKSIRLVPGENWVSLFGIPDTSTVSYVLGTNRLLGGITVANSPKVTLFRSGNVGTNLSGEVTNVVYLTASGNWVYSEGGLGSANNQELPLHQGFLLELPTNALPLDLVLIGRVPTNQVVQTLEGGSRTSPRYHLLGVPLPQRTPISQAGIVGSGFTANNNGSLADEVRILNNRNGRGSLESPKARLYRRTDNSWRYYLTPTNVQDFINGQIPTADNYILEPDDAVLIIRRNAGTMYWTNRLLYTPPGKNMNP